MLAQIFEFIGNHYILVSVFVFLLVAFFMHERGRGGRSVSASDLVSLVNREGAVVLDLRDKKEFSAGHITGAVNLPYAGFAARVDELDKYRGKPMVLVCKMGQHAGPIGRQLKAQGFDDVRRLAGGMAEWTAGNLPVVK